MFQKWDPTPRVVELIDGMYAPKESVHENWVSYAFQAFEILNQRDESDFPASFAAIGTGPGLDAIGASLIFKQLRTIIITDVQVDIVSIARSNVVANVRPDISVISMAGDVCFPIKAAGYTVDVAYANLPSILAKPGSHQTQDHNSFYTQTAEDSCPAVLRKYLLALQYKFLCSARSILSENGYVLMMLGGRFPLDVLPTLALAAGYRFDEVISCLKVQSEAVETTRGFALHEDEVEFDFYLYDAAYRASELTLQTGQALKTSLADHRISAASAYSAAKEGVRVGHTVHVIKATPNALSI